LIKKERSFTPVSDIAEQNFASTSPAFNQLDFQIREYDNGDHDNAIISERNEGIQQVTQDLLTLQEIFADVSTMVGEQGQELEQVEVNIAEADLAVAQATAELQEAGYLHSSATKKKVWLYFICVLGVVVVAAIIGVLIWKFA